MKAPAYPKYKASGVEWLSDVPQYWNVVPFKHLCERSALYGANISSDDYAREGVRFLRTTDISDYGNLLSEGVFVDPQDAMGYFLKDGDILVSRSGTLGRTFVFRQRKHPECAYAGYLVRFVPSEKLNPQFFFYYSKCGAFTDWLQTQIISSTIGNVNGQKYAQCPLPYPPRSEQDVIVDFLDAETGKLDTLIAKKRELIEKLKEKRTALISRTVTGGLPPEAARAAGLNPNPKLKPSGIEWLGDIPEHWHVLPFTKYVAEKSDYRGKTPEKVTEGVFLVTAKNVRMGFIDYDSSQEYVSEEDYDEIMRRGLPKKGDVLFTTEAPLGNVALVDREDIALAQRIIRFRMQPSWFVSAFTLYAMMSDHFQLQLVSLSTGSTAEGLKASKLPLLRLIAPPVPEQHTIADYLDRETTKIDRMVAKVEEAIERLQEYRTALVTAAVTGKIDVRTKH